MDNPLLTAYDAQVRASFAQRVPQGWTATTDGDLTRCLTRRGGFAMASTGLSDLGDEELTVLVDRTVAYFDAHQRSFEWKTFDHDRADLRPLLEGRGFVAEAHETLVLGEAAPLATEVSLPAGLVMREVRDRGDLERIAAMQSQVWGEDWSWLADDLAGRLDDPREPVVVFVVEDGAALVSAAWLTPLAGTAFAGLWGGSTLATHRGRGIYRALVARRAREALDRGFSMLQVDASDDSRPILERLGLHAVGGTTPYRWTPAP